MSLPIIAIVDDEQDLLDNFKILLDDQFQLFTFNSPRAFLENLSDLQAKGLKLLISDFKMPGMNGLELVQKAQEQFPNLPFILLSGFLDKKTALDAMALGVFRLLEKPCHPNVILEAIDQILVEAELRDVRFEIRQITSQLREIYTTLRISLSQYIPEDVMARMIVDPDNAQSEGKMSFEDLLENLESRLDQLLASEKLMNQVRENKNDKQPA